MKTMTIKSKIGLMALALLAFGCGGTEFGSTGAGNGDGLPNSESGTETDPNGTSTNPAANPPTTPAEILLACADAQASHQSLTTTINFPPRTNCSFGVNGNGGRVDGFHMAREIQEQVINLPSKAIICGVARFSSGLTAQITYDDFMFLTLEDYVLVSTSSSLVSLLASDQNLKLWDWSKIYTQPFEGSPTPYCLGASCTFPGHDQTGPISLDFQSQEMSQLSAKLLNKSQASLKVIVTGDNDDGDCEHSGFDIDLDLDYIVQ